MGAIAKTITEREKAAIYMHIFGGVNDWRLLYSISAQEPQDKVTNSPNLQVYTSRWKNSEKIQNFIQEVKQIQLEQAAKTRTRLIEEIEREKAESEQPKQEQRKRDTKVIDYSDPENRKQLYNEVIRDAADDPKTRLDAAKVFEQIQRDDKQAAKDNQIQRFYTPITCKSCPLYEKAQARKKEK